MMAAGLGPAEQSVENCLAIAVGAARTAGDVLAAASQSVRSSSAVHSGRDVKLTADRESELLIVEYLRARMPFAILSEEAGVIPGAGQFTWVVDPLDGSANYYFGIPFACVAIALLEGDVPIAGVVYDFARGEMFSGAVGVGAWINGQPIHVRTVTDPSEAVLCTGFPAASDFRHDSLSALVEGLRAFKKVRLLGSAALSLAYVAAGRADAYFERDIRLWDVAAGLAIVRAAGGRVSMTRSAAANHAVTAFAASQSLAATLA